MGQVERDVTIEVRELQNEYQQLHERISTKLRFLPFCEELEKVRAEASTPCGPAAAAAIVILRGVLTGIYRCRPMPAPLWTRRRPATRDVTGCARRNV